MVYPAGAGVVRGHRGNIMAIVDLNDSGLGLVRDESDITAQWVEGILHGTGDLAENVGVESVALERIGDGVGMLSILMKVSPRYSAATTAPASLVVKFPTTDPTQRFTADALAFYVREIVFYRDHASQAPFRTPRCYAQAIAPDSTDFTVVMEDVGNMRTLNQLDGITLAEAKVLLDKLADFHALWWESPRLDELAGIFQPLSNPTYHAVLPMLWQGGWPVVMEHAPHLVPNKVAPIGEMWPTKVNWMLDTLMTPRTMCHGDYRADNIMFDGNDPVVLDFQIVGHGSGIYDVGYLISQSLPTEVRRGHDRELVDHYCARLESNGISVDREEMWRQYRVTVVFCATYSVTLWPSYTTMNERGQSLVRDMLERSLLAVADVDGLAAIE